MNNILIRDRQNIICVGKLPVGELGNTFLGKVI